MFGFGGKELFGIAIVALVVVIAVSYISAVPTNFARKSQNAQLK